MKLRLRVILLSTVMVVLLSTGQGDHQGEKHISYTDMLRVFAQIAEPYGEKKTARNQNLDKQVNIISEQIQSIIPDLEIMHNYIQNLSSGMTLVKTNITEPLVRAKVSLRQAVTKLNRCNIQQDSSNLPLNIIDVNSEEEHKLASPTGHEHKKSHQLHEINSPDEDRDASSIPVDLFSPAKVDESTLSTILSRFDSNSVVSLRDAAKAFKAVADTVAHAHQLRFMSFVPKVKNVKDNIVTITNHVTSEKKLLAGFSASAKIFFEHSMTSLTELTNLTTTALNFAQQTC